MLTKNFYQGLGTVLYGGTPELGMMKTATGETAYPLRFYLFRNSMSGSSWAAWWGSFFPFVHIDGDPAEAAASDNTNGMQGGIFFGSGTTAPTMDDYTLESPVSGLSAVNASGVFSWTEDGLEAIRALIVTNNSTSAVTISEVGSFTPYLKTQSSATANPTANGLFMTERTVLDTSITLAPGESKTNNYTIKFRF